MGGSQSKETPPSPPPSPLLVEAWRTLDWSGRRDMKENLRNFQLSNSDVKALRILVHGPVAAGKSSFINSIDFVFQDRMSHGAISQAQTVCSFTKTYRTHKIKDGRYEDYLPFVICDIMGLEGGDCAGAHTDDLIKALKGHLKDGYMFNPLGPCSEENPNYNSTPNLSDTMHCLVSVIPADTITLKDDKVFAKMRQIRALASEMMIPQIVVLTKVDKACPEVNKDIKLIYNSKKIKEKMEECSCRLGVPMNCIFPVKNYHEEIDLSDEVDVLLLSALTHILNFANDHVAEMESPAPNTP